jgi:hypothetical protein
MTRFFRIALLTATSLACLSTLLACSPKLNWREVRGAGAPYSVMLPAKPSSQARPVNLDGRQVTMTMTATEVDGVTFAVGTAELPDAAAARAALASIKTALIRNINGTIRHEKSSPPGLTPMMIEIEASGQPDAATDHEPRLLTARFIAKERRVYQLVITGKESAVSQDAIDTFFQSFKPD